MTVVLAGSFAVEEDGVDDGLIGGVVQLPRGTAALLQANPMMGQ